LEETLVMFDHFQDFDKLVEDGTPRQGEIMGSYPFCGLFGLLGFM
jgi:hypothetical protein